MAVNDPLKYRQTYNLENQIYVEADYNNIIIIDPNKVLNSNNEVQDRFVQQENLVMYANLETKIIPRTKLAIGDNFDNPVNNTTIASLTTGDEDLDINFLRPKGKKYFDTSWSDDFTGKDSTSFNATNQKIETTIDDNGTKKFSTSFTNFEDAQTLGITSIQVNISSVGVPTVDMKLVDIRGRTLFEQGDNSLYSVFFNLPYPTFYLTLKGYYGKAIKYQLTLLSFNAKFDPANGNFEITLKLMGRNSAILSDSIVSFAKHSPKMFTTEVETKKNNVSSNSTGNDKTQIIKENDTKGLQKLREVYSLYKSKNLIDQDVDPITMEAFIDRANNYEKNVQERIKKGDFNIVNDLSTYQTTLNDLRQTVYINSINTFLDTTERLVYNGVVYYPYSESISDEKKREESKNLMKNKFDENVKKLEENPSFGKGKTYKLPSGKQESGEIEVKVKFDDIVKTIDYNTITNDDFKQSYEINFNKTPSDQELQKYITEFKSFNAATQTIIDSNLKVIQSNPTYFTFGEIPNKLNEFKQGSFLFYIQKMNKDLEAKRNIIETSLTDELANMIVDDTVGLGFRPTIRNIFGVLFAGLDTYYRLMEDVHVDAWKQRKNPARLQAILPPQKTNISTDSLNVVNGSFQLNDENIVYPWPQYFETEKQKDGSELYVIKYPGDANDVSTINNVVWPEIAFTEEFINATLQKSTPVKPTQSNNDKTNTNYMSVNAVEFPFNTFPYQDLTEVNFLYELFERSYLSTHYSNINRGEYKTKQIDKVISNIDAENILTSLRNYPSPTLNIVLKQNLDYTTFLEYLKKISGNGEENSWQTYLVSEYNKEYIKNYFSSLYNKIYSIDTIDSVSVTVAGDIPQADKLKNYINSTESSSEYFLDPYPFNDIKWLKTNLQDGDTINSVNDFYKTETYLFLDDKKTIARLSETETKNNINLFVNKFGFNNYGQSYITDQTTNNPVTSRDNLKTYYENRLPKNQYITESFVDYGNDYSGNLQSKIQTTTILNTPYFINALQEGVELEKDPNNKSPYISLGYLFLNSLPLITTKEKIKESVEGQEPNELDYLAATLNKFSSIHKVPYAWVLKYGSIWHRYKKFVEENIDILDNCWKDFDYLKNYDPNTSNPSLAYSGDWAGNIILQSSSTIPTTNILSDTITFGFYPKVINDIYRYFYSQDLSFLQAPTYTNFLNESINNGLKVANTFFISYQPGVDSTNPTRQITIKNNYQYFTKPNGGEIDYLLVPSMGGLTFNQGVFECFNNVDVITEEVFDNTSLYNGSVRSLWSAPNFGYYNNNLIKKPKYNEYLKTIIPENGKKQNPFDLKNNQSVYSNIEEIFAVFEPTILDEFEKLFLTFCSDKPTAESMTLTDEKNNNFKLKTLKTQIHNLFLVPQNAVTLTDNQVSNGRLLAEAQIKNFESKLCEFLKFDCVLKMGNPSNYNRKTFNYFTNNPTFKQNVDLQLNTYIQGTLPGDGVLNGTGALITSQINKPDEWVALKKYIGEFEQDGIKYTDTGSSITDFFIKNQVEFSVSNIQSLYPLIRIYAKEKLKDNTFNDIKFKQLINTYVTDQKNFNADVLNETFRYLNSKLDDVKITTAPVKSVTSGNVAKLEYYTTLKTSNDKWIAGSDFINRTIFEDFLFLDRANRDIGNDFLISVEDMETLLKDPNKNYLVLISKILQKNNFLFFAMPAYINFYGLQEASANAKPIPVEVPQSLFGTYLDVDYIGSRPKFLCVYVGKPSEYVASESSFVKFRDDAFDLRKTDNPLNKEDKADTDFSKKNKVVGFAVDYGIQNQSIFRSVSLDMSEKRNTAESNRLTTQLGESASGNKVAQQTVSLYSIYKTRSYTCQVESMGNVMIQPTMYFNLRHVPLFYGPYWIMEVSHSVGPGKFDTSFKGVRMPVYSLPQPNSLLDSVNKNYLNYYKELILQTQKQANAPTSISQVITQTNAGGIQGSEEGCKKLSKYDLPFVDLKITNISESELKDLINNSNVSSELKALYYGVIKTKFLNTNDGSVWSCPNYNLYNVGSFNSGYSQTLISTVKNQFCATSALLSPDSSYPYFNFTSFEESLNFYDSIVKSYKPVIEQLKNKSTKTEIYQKYAEAYTLFTLFWDQLRYVDPNGRTGYYLEPPKTVNDFLTRFTEKGSESIVENAILNYTKIFEDSYKIFFP